MNKKRKPPISVVMPAYNSEKYISEAIESILNQTYKNFEFIITNDGSTDKTLSIIKKYAKQDKRIKIINNEKNLGISPSLNNGVKASKGKYIAIMNHDDISLTTRFEEQIKHMEKHPEIGILGTFIETFDERGNVFIRKYPVKDSKIRKKIFFYSPLSHPSTIIRKEVFSEVGFYKERASPCEDVELYFRVGERYKLENLPKILLRYRIHKSTVTMRKTRLMEKKANWIRWKYRNSKAYHFGAKEFLYNLLHLISLYIIPTKFKSWVYLKLIQRKVK